ncbi:MAG: copper resistance protein CopC, partial [Gemmatimonadaceae bacterium]|nr:copper resistance protein CopC [Gemmatimonadaceae bacterium]
MRRSTLVAATVISLGGILTPRITAFAHGRLESSTPAAGSTLATAPSELRLKFTEIPELVFTTLRLVGPSGDSVVLGPIHYSPDSRRAIVAAIRNPLAAGKYTVMWQMAGPDG